MSDLARAIAFLEDCRQTHVDWAVRLRENPDDPALEYVHTPDEQDEIVAEYDNALALLRGEP